MATLLQQKKTFSDFKEEKIMGSLSPALNVMIKAVRKAGKMIVRDFSEVENLQITKKAPADFVAKTVAKSRDTLLAELRRARPNYSFVIAGEEKIEGEDTSNTFILEPLDGVTNFMRAISFFSVSAALVRDGDILAGVTYNPVLDELYYAEKGTGAYLMTARGDRRLRVSGRRNLADALIGIDIAGKDAAAIDLYQERLRIITANTEGARRMGAPSLALAMVAAGKLDAYWCHDIAPTSIAAGLVMVKEAGGHARSASGKDKLLEVLESASIIATNDEMDFAVTKALRDKK